MQAYSKPRRMQKKYRNSSRIQSNGKKLWEEGAIASLVQLQNHTLTAKGIKQASLRLTYRIGRDDPDSEEQKAWYGSKALYENLYRTSPNVDTDLSEILKDCRHSVKCKEEKTKVFNDRENRNKVIDRTRSLGKSLQWSRKEKEALNVIAKKNKELAAHQNPQRAEQLLLTPNPNAFD